MEPSSPGHGQSLARNAESNRPLAGRRRGSRGLLAIGVLACVAAGAIGCWLTVTPRWYTARTLAELGSSTSAGASSASQPTSHEERVASLAAVIRSPEVLQRVVDQHDLVKRWNLPGPEEATAKLRSMLTIASEPGTDLITGQVTATNPDEAARLANAVWMAFLEHGTGKVTLHEKATPPQRISAPNYRGWGALAGFLVLIGMGSMTAGWAMRGRG